MAGCAGETSNQEPDASRASAPWADCGGSQPHRNTDCSDRAGWGGLGADSGSALPWRTPELRSAPRGGAYGVLQSEEPMLSPILWTTLATGRDPLAHQILDFVEDDPVTGATVPISVRGRKVPALWDLFSRGGLEPAVVAWWASWPAYPLKGRIVSDRVAFSAFRWEPEDLSGAGLFHPPELAQSLNSLRVRPEEMSRGRSGRVRGSRRWRPGPGNVAAIEAGGSPFDIPLTHLREVLASTRSYHRMTLQMTQGPATRPSGGLLPGHRRGQSPLCPLSARLPSSPVRRPGRAVSGAPSTASTSCKTACWGNCWAPCRRKASLPLSRIMGSSPGPGRPVGLAPRRGAGGAALVAPPHRRSPSLGPDDPAW